MMTPPSHLNLKFAAFSFLCFLTEPFDGCEDFVSGFDPFVGFGVRVVGIYELPDISFQFCHGAVDTALQLLACQFGKPALDLVDP